jgi:peptide/nickel transport system substrate-binding protein
MKARLTSQLIGVVILTITLLTGYHTAMAASSGELKLVQDTWGHGVPIPRMERSAALDWLKLLYDPLVGTTADGKLSPDYGLTTKWERTPDGLTWTFYLRKGVKFHDGVELTAKDVKFSIEQLILPDSTAGISEEIMQSVKAVEIKDPYTLVVHCKRPAIFFHTYFSDITTAGGLIMPKDYYERVGKDQFMKKPIGTGPYKWHSQVVGSYIKLEAIDKHWRDGVPRYKYMTYLYVPEESTRVAMLKTGEADVTRVGRESVREARDAGLKLITKKDAAAIVFQFLMQWATPAFSDIRFRKALNLAVDRQAIVKNILGGIGAPITGFPGNTIFACGGDPNLKPYPYDLQEARRLIKEGGYEGYEFNIPSYPREGLPELHNVVETLVGYWQKIGLKPKIFMTDWGTFRASWRAHKVLNTVSGTDVPSAPECGTLLGRMEERYASYEKRGIVHDPKMDVWLKKASSSLDEAEVAKNLGEAYRYSYDQYLTIPICMVNHEIAATKRVPDWDPGLRRDDRNINAIIRQP